MCVSDTARKVFRYKVFSSPYFPVFGLNMGKYGPEKTPYLAVRYKQLQAVFHQPLFKTINSRGSHLEVSFRKTFLKISKNSQETPKSDTIFNNIGEPIFDIVADCRHAFLLKRNFGIGIIILKIFENL